MTIQKTLTNAQIANAARALDRILATADGLPGGAVQVPLVRSLRVLRPLADDVEAARRSLLREHAQLDGAGEPVTTPVAGAPEGTVTVQLRDTEAAQAALDELLSAETQVALHAPDLACLPTLAAGDVLALVELFDPVPDQGTAGS